MKIIPVIDYMQGHVVLAKMGMRDEYQPVCSELCKSSDINQVIQAILTIAKFKTIYIADLDCIQKQHLDPLLWPKLCSQYSEVEFWIDIGSMCNQWTHIMHHTHNARPILGSESFASIEQLTTTIENLSDYKPLLSIDIKNSEILGPCDLLQHTEEWPKDIIVLSISRVGSKHGPDMQVVEQIKKVSKQANLYYGGGIRNSIDIQQAGKYNISGILIASLLHNRKLNEQEVRQLIC